MIRFRNSLALLILVGCVSYRPALESAPSNTVADATRDSVVVDSIRQDSIRRDSVRQDSIRQDSVKKDSAKRMEVKRPTPPRIIPLPPSDTASIPSPDAVPIGAKSPLIEWGPLPAGEERPERPRTYDLTHQTVRIRFDWTRHAVVGKTALKLSALESPVSTVVLDAVGMTISDVTGPSGAKLKYAYDGSTLSVSLPSALQPSRATTINVTYEAAPKKGVYFIDRKHVVWTQGETQETRHWIPTYDAPNDKTTWEFYITTAKNEKALSNGRLVASRPIGEEIEWHWLQNKPASTYLMSAVTGDFTVLQDKWRDMPVGYWVDPDSTQAGWRGFGRTPRMIEAFSKKLRYDYPWQKYDQSAVPDFIYGGMENVTATTQNDNAILLPTWATREQSSDGLVSHELAHQWFGDLLTTRHWSDIWLNEGFATFMEVVWFEEDGKVDVAATTRLEHITAVVAADRAARRPLVFSRWRNDPIELFFSGHIYPKGAAVLNMLRHELGDSLFWRAMHDYVETYAFGSVVTDDLKRAIEKTTGRDLTRFFQQWVYGAGMPAYRVSYTYDAPGKRAVIKVYETQPTDSLTGHFDVDVDVEILTDSGPARAKVPVRNGEAQIGIPVPAEPRSIRWDKGRWVLSVYDFPRTTRMLAYQLGHDDDITGRLEALAVLGERSRDTMARSAVIAAATEDMAWQVRAAALRAAAALTADSTSPAIAVQALADPDPRVRVVAVSIASSNPSAELGTQFADLARSDSSYTVRANALAAYIAREKDAALPLARELLALPEWTASVRAPVLVALRRLDTPEARALAAKYRAPGEQ
jgi:aminopeptidase N